MGQKSRSLDCVFKSEKEYIGEKKRTQNRSIYAVFLITRREDPTRVLKISCGICLLCFISCVIYLIKFSSTIDMSFEI